MARETGKDDQLRAAQKIMSDAAASLRARTGQEISGGHLDTSQTVPPHGRYRMASLLEALSHDVAQRRLSQWASDEAVKLAHSILGEDSQEQGKGRG
jgi:hypothetical protein